MSSLRTRCLILDLVGLWAGFRVWMRALFTVANLSPAWPQMHRRFLSHIY